jgi:hypothetical protein
VNSYNPEVVFQQGLSVFPIDIAVINKQTEHNVFSTALEASDVFPA